MQRICILALIGLPAAGKTTFTRWICSSLKLNAYVVHLCYDDFFGYYSDSTESNFKMRRLEMFDLLRILIDKIRRTNRIPFYLQNKLRSIAIVDSNDYLIVCDDNNYYHSMRYKLYQFCRLNNLAYSQIYLECDLPMALYRNTKRSDSERIPQHILENMEARLELPDTRKRSWESVTLILNTSVHSVWNETTEDSVIVFISNAFENICQDDLNETKAKQTQPPTNVHKLDLLLRQRISELLKFATTAMDKKSTALRLNTKRKRILRTFKENNELTLTVQDLNKFIELLH